MPSSSTLLALTALLSAFTQDAQAQLFTVNCARLTAQRGDPIVFPGVISPHVHAVVGGTAFRQDEPNSVARNSRATTCDKLLDKSNYWQPHLYHQRHDGKFEMVTFQGAAAYYLNRVCDYAPGRTNCNDAPDPVAPPAGLRMVVGNPFRRDYDDSNLSHRAISHVCLGSNSEEGPRLPTEKCERMRAETFFPSCWNGKDLDTSDHASHMAFPDHGDYNFGVCPESHPHAIFSVFFEFFYDTGAVQDFNRWVWAMGDPTGLGLHGDYLQGWSDQGRLEEAMRTCTGNGGVDDPGCSLNVGSDGSPGHSSSQELETPAPNEEVGLTGNVLDKLPGNNPVTP